MDNLGDNLPWKPDPPGEHLVLPLFNTHFDGGGSISTLTETHRQVNFPWPITVSHHLSFSPFKHVFQQKIHQQQQLVQPISVLMVTMPTMTMLGYDSVDYCKGLPIYRRTWRILPEKSHTDAVLCIFIRYCIFLAVFFDTNTLHIHKYTNALSRPKSSRLLALLCHKVAS
jgi:hypothetical protein